VATAERSDSSTVAEDSGSRLATGSAGVGCNGPTPKRRVPLWPSVMPRQIVVVNGITTESGTTILRRRTVSIRCPLESGLRVGIRGLEGIDKATHCKSQQPIV
jgi:hypothetical protein